MSHATTVSPSKNELRFHNLRFQGHLISNETKDREVVRVSCHAAPLSDADDISDVDHPELCHFWVQRNEVSTSVREVAEEMARAGLIPYSAASLLRSNRPAQLVAPTNSGKISSQNGPRLVTADELRLVIDTLQSEFIVDAPVSQTIGAVERTYQRNYKYIETKSAPVIDYVVHSHDQNGGKKQSSDLCQWIDIELPIPQSSFRVENALRILLALKEQGQLEGLTEEQITDTKWEFMQNRGFKLLLNDDFRFEGSIEKEKIFMLVSPDIVITLRSGPLDYLYGDSLEGKTSIDMIKMEIRGEELPSGRKCFTHSDRGKLSGGTLAFEIAEQLSSTQHQVVKVLDQRLDSMLSDLNALPNPTRLSNETRTFLNLAKKSLDQIDKKIKPVIVNFKQIIPQTKESDLVPFFNDISSKDVVRYCEKVTDDMQATLKAVQGAYNKIQDMESLDKTAELAEKDRRSQFQQFLGSIIGPPALGAMIAAIPAFKDFSAEIFWGGVMSIIPIASCFLLYNFRKQANRY